MKSLWISLTAVVIALFGVSMATVVNNSEYIFSKEKYYSQSEVDKITSTSNDKTDQIEDLTSQKENDNLTISSLKSQILALNSQIKELENVNNNLNSRLENVIEEYNTVSNNYSLLCEEYDKNVTELTETKSQVEVLEAEKLSLQSQITQTEESIANLNSVLESLGMENSELETELSNQQSHLESLQSTYEATNEELESANLKINSLTLANEDLNSRLSNAESQVSFYYEEMTDARNIANEYINKCSELEAQIEELNAEIEDLKAVKYEVKFMVDEVEYEVQTVKENNYATLPTEPTKEGFRFEGWTINSEDVIENIEATPVTRNVTYIAKFKTTYTITYMIDNEVYTTQTVDAETTKTTLPTGLENIGDLEFSGWVIESEYNRGNYSARYNDEYYYSQINSNITFYAYYARRWTVTTIILGETNSWKVVEGEALCIPNPERSGYTFKYWSYDGVTDCGLDLELAYVEEDTTFIAVFEALPVEYTVVFNDDNGYICDRTYHAGECITLPSTPTKSDYKFIGWGFDGDNDVIENIESIPVEELQSGSTFIALIAKFELI